MRDKSAPEGVQKVIEWLNEQPEKDSPGDEIDVLTVYFDRVADLDPGPVEREAVVAEAVEYSAFLTKKAARRQLSKARGVDRDRSA